MSASKREFERQEELRIERMAAKYEAQYEVEKVLAKAGVQRARTRLFLIFIMSVLMLFLIAVSYFLTSQQGMDKIALGVNPEFFVGILAAVIAGLLIGLYPVFKRYLRISVSSEKEIIESSDSIDDDKAARASVKFLGMEISYSIPRTENNSLEEFELDQQYGTIDVDWFSPLLSAKNGIIGENKRLAARSSGNLSTGMAISAIGMIFLIVLIFFPNLFPTINDNTNVIASYVPRLTLVAFLQVLAAFFLKLYVGNEKAIERNNKELSNIYLRLSACLLVGETPESRQSLAKNLIAEDRNKLVHKGKGESLSPEYFTLLQQILKGAEK